jgi:hypothetical protein
MDGPPSVLSLAVNTPDQFNRSSTCDLAHSGFFLVVNVFLWVQDIVMGDGLSEASIGATG